MPASPNIIAQLGTSWKLDVAAIATFSYQHPTFGSLVYSGNAETPWLCDNVNTLTLTSKGTLPDGVLPEKVCIRPKFDSECGGGSYDLNGYPNPEDKCLAADPECPREFDLFVECNDCNETETQTISPGDTPGLDCPDNPSYTMTSVLCNQTMLVTWYFCAGSWKADITVNGTFCTTEDLGPPESRCPLVIGRGVSNCDYLYVDCHPTGDDECCLIPPEELTGDLTCTSCDGCTDTTAITLTGNEQQFTGSASLCGILASIEINCLDGTYTLTGSMTVGLNSCTITPTTATNQTDCPAIILDFTIECDGGSIPYPITMTLSVAS